MSNTNLNFEYDVRIPDALIQQLLDGEITGAMLLTMTILYKWSTWGTGKVRRVCASSLCYASQKAFSERTFSEALRKLEWMRWITRHMVTGSTKWYRVTIHNYKWTDDAGKVHILNPTDIKVYDKYPEGRCGEASKEGSWETSDEGTDEGSDRLLSLPESEPKSENESLPESEHQSKERQVSKEVSEAQAAAQPYSSHTENQVVAGSSQTFNWSERNQREFSMEEVGLAGDYLMVLFPRSDLGETDSVLMAEIALDFQARYPDPNTYTSYYPEIEDCHTVTQMRNYLDWNRKHKKGGMVHANVAEFHRAWFSDNDRCARNQWEDHESVECPKCKPKATANEPRAKATPKPQVESEPTIFGAPVPAACAFHREELIRASRLRRETAPKAVRDMMAAIRKCAECDAVNAPEPGSIEELIHNRAKAAVANSFDEEEA